MQDSIGIYLDDMKRRSIMNDDNIPGPACGYTDLLDLAITEKQDEDSKKVLNREIKRNPLRPSSAGNCSRALAIELAHFRGKLDYVKKPLDPNVARLLELGHAVEYHALRQFQLIKVVEQRYKQQVLTFFPIERGIKDVEAELLEGSCDVAFWHKDFRCVADVKSKKDGWSSSYKSKWEEDIAKFEAMNSVVKISDTACWIPDLPAFLKEIGEDFIASNFKQLNLYACSEFMKQRGVNHAFLYYYNKNDSRHYEMRFNPSDEVFEEVKEKFNRVSRMVDEGILPDHCDFTPGSMRYAFCDCHQYDGTSQDAREEWFKTFPKKSWPTNQEKLSNDLIKDLELYKALSNLTKDREIVELRIIKGLLEDKIKKVKLESGEIYELRHLKSPRPHYVLRRTKS